VHACVCVFVRIISLRYLGQIIKLTSSFFSSESFSYWSVLSTNKKRYNHGEFFSMVIFLSPKFPNLDAFFFFSLSLSPPRYRLHPVLWRVFCFLFFALYVLTLGSTYTLLSCSYRMYARYVANAILFGFGFARFCLLCHV